MQDENPLLRSIEPPQPPPPPYQPYQPAPQPTPKGWAALSARKCNVVLGCAGLISLCIFCSLCGTLISAFDGGNTAGNASAQQQTATSTATRVATLAPAARATTTPSLPKPTATPDPNRGLAAYKSVVLQDAGTMSADMTKVGNACSSGDTGACYAALQTFDTDVQAFQRDLKAHPAPACLADADTNLRKALNLYDSGAQLAMNGIDQNDASLIQQGTADMTEGTTYIQVATSDIQNSLC